jgi:lipopolysaccharide/colanic/teichoic acid biosynthesis glycosyltransferase
MACLPAPLASVPPEGGHPLLLDIQGRPAHTNGTPPELVRNPAGALVSFVRKGKLRVGHPWYEPIKRAVEVVVSLVLLILAVPVMFLAALLVKVTSPGPALYAQTRVGRRGRYFQIYKIRTMHHNCESLSGPRWSTPGDPRITWVGRFLRSTHLDELPQLVNVLRGDMSLIGPRPERPEFLKVLEDAVTGYRDRLVVRPGVTGLAQVNLPADTDLASVQRKLAYDLYYIERLSPWLDLQILLGTICYVLRIPYETSRKLLLMPSKETIEQSRKMPPKPMEKLGATHERETGARA